MIWWQWANQPRWQQNLWVPIQITMIWSFPHLSAQLVTLLSPLSVSTYCKSFIGHNSQCISQLTVFIGGQKCHFCGSHHWFNRIPTDFLGLDIWLNWIITINQFSLNRKLNWVAFEQNSTIDWIFKLYLSVGARSPLNQIAQASRAMLFDSQTHIVPLLYFGKAIWYAQLPIDHRSNIYSTRTG